MMLGIVVSLPWELKSLTRDAISVGAWKAISDNVLVALSGIGPERAYAAGAVLVAQGATALLSWGYAAALDDRLRPGYLLLPAVVVGADGALHPVSADWHRHVRETLCPKQRFCSDALVESDVIVNSSREKHALAIRTRAVATDMESAAQGRLAEEHRLPFMVIRAIVDTAVTAIPQQIVDTFNRQGECKARHILLNAARRPAEWVALMRLGMQFNAAQRALKQARGAVLDAPWS